MAKCDDCGEYQATKGGLCPICQWRCICEEELAHVAAATLIASTGLNFHLWDSRNPPSNLEDFVQRVVTVVQRFHARTPPEKALPIGSNIDEDIAQITGWMKEVTGKDICSMLQDIYAAIIRTRPDLDGDDILVQLLKISCRPLPGCPRNIVMVSVLSSRGMVRYISLLGFTRVTEIDISKVNLEVTGGYWSCLRGDKGSSSRNASVFSLSPYHFLKDTTFQRHDLSFGMSLEHFRGSEVAHFVGPEDSLLAFLLDMARDPWPNIHLGSFVGDLKIALLWWKDKQQVRVLTSDRGPLGYED